MLLREAGFNKVFCSDINVDRLDMVQKFGGIPLQAGMSTWCQNEMTYDIFNPQLHSIVS